jgi:fucose permease
VLREYFRHVAGFTTPARFYLAAQFFYAVGQTAVWVLRNLYFKEKGFSEDFIGQTLAVSSFGAMVVVLTMSLRPGLQVVTAVGFHAARFTGGSRRR